MQDVRKLGINSDIQLYFAATEKLHHSYNRIFQIKETCHMRKVQEKYEKGNFRKQFGDVHGTVDSI